MHVWTSSSPWRRAAYVAVGLLLGVGPARADDAGEPDAPPASPPAAAPDDGNVTPAFDERVQAAVKRGVAWLRGRPRPNGSLGNLERSDEKTYDGTVGSYVEPYGGTSLLLYTLMKCGVPESDPLVKNGLAWLRKSKDDGTAYEISMELLAVTATADPFKHAADSAAAGGKVRLSGENRAWAEGLLANLIKKRGTLGWRYWGRGDDNKGGNQDTSSTQLAVLAMFAAERCGLKIDPKIWSDVIRFALAQQEEDGPSRRRAVHPKPPPGRPPASSSDGSTTARGADDDETPDKARGFAYVRLTGPDPEDREASGAMTACGLGIVTMARFSLMTRSPRLWAKEDAARVQQGVYDGLAWLDANWSPFKNKGGNGHWDLYYVYCVERAMDLVGSQRLGNHVWYLDMAKEVLSKQREDGSWTGGAATTFHADTLDTCFALLFLQRATRGGIPYPSVTGGSDVEPVDGR